MRAAEAVINSPEQVPRRQQIIFQLFTLLGWAFFTWISLPFAVAVAQFLGLRRILLLSLLKHDQVDPVVLFGLCASSMSMTLLLLTWAEAQRHRFTGLERRKRSPDVPIREVAKALGASREIVETLHTGRIVSLRMTSDGTPEAATIMALPEIATPTPPEDEALTPAEVAAPAAPEVEGPAVPETPAAAAETPARIPAQRQGERPRPGRADPPLPRRRPVVVPVARGGLFGPQGPPIE